MFWRINLLLSLVFGVTSLLSVSVNPSEEQNAVLLGFSLYRLIVISFIVTGIVSIIFLFIQSFRPSSWNGRISRSIKGSFEKRGYCLGLFLLGISYIILFTSNRQLGGLSLYRESLYSVFVWMIVTSLQILLTYIVMRTNRNVPVKLKKNTVFGVLVLWGTFLIIVLSISFTKIGLKPDVTYWQDAGAPLLFWQVVTSWIVGGLVFILSGVDEGSGNNFIEKLLKSHNIDIFICLGIWVVAFIAWASFPVRPSYNALPSRAPNFESYPFGDALIFDINAQNYLIGIPIPNDFWQKPFYSFFLALLHGVAGQDYELLTQIQVGILAIIPVVVYLLTFVLSNRPTGLIAASLIIFRELNSLSLSNVIQISHSKLLMSDVFSMGLMVLLVFLLIIWLKEPDNRRVLPFVIGGTFGILVLTRGHAMLLLPFIVLAAMIVLIPARQVRRFLEGTIVLLLGLSIPLGFWIWRNYQWTGKPSLQDPISPYTTQIARLYSLTPLSDPVRFPNEDDTAYYTRIQKQPVDFITDHPGSVVSFVSAHYVHNMIFSFVYLPNSLIIENTGEYVRRMPFWKNWQGELSLESRGFLIANLFILAMGVRRMYAHEKNLLLVLLLLGIGYNLSVSVGRLSGWRLIMPADWITTVMYSAGLIELTLIAKVLIFGDVPSQPNVLRMKSDISPDTYWNWLVFTGAGVVFVVLGLGLTQGHKLATATYPQKSAEEILQQYRTLLPEQPQVVSEDAMRRFLEQDQAVALYGRGLYPSFLPVNSGELNYFYPAFAPKPYRRLVFQLIGPEEIGVILPLSSSPKIFPNAADTIVFGCYMENKHVSSLPGYVDALAVVVKTNPPVLYIRHPVRDLHCPFSE